VRLSCRVTPAGPRRSSFAWAPGDGAARPSAWRPKARALRRHDEWRARACRPACPGAPLDVVPERGRRPARVGRRRRGRGDPRRLSLEETIRSRASRPAPRPSS
jgi:hypothetical protein